MILLSILGYSFEFVRKAYSSNLYGHIDNKRISFEICLPDNIVVIQPWLNFKNFNPVYFFTTKKADYGIFTGDFDKLPEDVKSNLHELASQEDYIYYWTCKQNNECVLLT